MVCDKSKNPFLLRIGITSHNALKINWCLWLPATPFCTRYVMASYIHQRPTAEPWMTSLNWLGHPMCRHPQIAAILPLTEALPSAKRPLGQPYTTLITWIYKDPGPTSIRREHANPKVLENLKHTVEKQFEGINAWLSFHQGSETTRLCRLCMKCKSPLELHVTKGSGMSNGHHFISFHFLECISLRQEVCGSSTGIISHFNETEMKLMKYYFQWWIW